MKKREAKFVHKWRDAIHDKKELTSAEKMVLYTLAQFMDINTGECWPSHQVIAFHAGLSRRHVIRCINSAVSKGWLSKKRRLRKYNDITQAALISNKYKAIIKKTEKQEELESVNGWCSSDTPLVTKCHRVVTGGHRNTTKEHHHGTLPIR